MASVLYQFEAKPKPVGHSPLGGSAAYRFMACPGSIGLSQGWEDPESEYAAEGTLAHSLAEYCLRHDEDAWQHIRPKLGVTQEMANAVQVFLDAVRREHPDRNQGNTFIEKSFHAPRLHKYMWSKVDLGYHDRPERTLHMWDYKHGAGIVVEVEENPQCMYYGCGLLEVLDLWDEVDWVVLHIAQPRGWHFDGPLREWAISVADLKVWLNTVLIPAMDNALTSRVVKSGDHCRFCPARQGACPALAEDMFHLELLMEKIEEKGVAKLTNAELAQYMVLLTRAKIVGKTAQDQAFLRLQSGKEISCPDGSFKLGTAKANREWKEEAEKALKRKFGERAYTEPELKSPAQIEMLPEGKTMTARWAFKPDKGLVVVPDSDSRPAVNTTTKSLFQAATVARKKAKA